MIFLILTEFRTVLVVSKYRLNTPRHLLNKKIAKKRSEKLKKSKINVKKLNLLKKEKHKAYFWINKASTRIAQVKKWSTSNAASLKMCFCAIYFFKNASKKWRTKKNHAKNVYGLNNEKFLCVSQFYATVTRSSRTYHHKNAQ